MLQINDLCLKHGCYVSKNVFDREHCSRGPRNHFDVREIFSKEVKLTFLGLRAVLAVTDCSSLVKQRIICVLKW